MLVLKRQVGQEVLIEGGIAVRVVAIDGNGVKLGFEAPSEVGIKRAELLLKPQQAADVPPAAVPNMDVRGRIARAFVRAEK